MQNYIIDSSTASRNNRGGWGWLVVALVVLLLIGAGIWWLVRARADREPAADAPPAARTEPSATPPADRASATAPVSAVEPAVPSVPAPEVDALLIQARQAQGEGDLLAARGFALDAHRRAEGNPALQRQAEAILNTVNIELVMSPRMMPEKTEYVVQSGDSLARIAKQYGTTVELLRVGNDIRGSLIRVGDRLRVFTGNFRILVDKSDNELVLFMNDEFFKRCRVGTGEFNKTPVGTFEITDRIAQPTWWRPDGREIPYGDPDNLLGTHWLAINVRGYGIHGTWEPETIGHQLSAGCVRMLNENVEELFTLVTVGTPVEIRD